MAYQEAALYRKAMENRPIYASLQPETCRHIESGRSTPIGRNRYGGGIYLSSVHEELEMLVDAGLTPLEALQTATLNPAIYFGREKELGTISLNKFADLFLLNANPLEDITNTKDIESVWINGKYLNKGELEHKKITLF